MFDILSIIKANSATFYDYNTGRPRSNIYRFIFFVISSFLSMTMFQIGEALIQAFIGAQAILVGFSFAILIFLVSKSDGWNIDGTSMEQELRLEKLKKLEREIFVNICYYNLVSLASIIASILMLIEIRRPFNLVYIVKLFYELPLYQKMPQIIGLIDYISSSLVVFLMIESIFTFFRTIIRVNYYFFLRTKVENEAT